MSKTKWMTILGVIALVSTIYLVIGVRSGEELFIDEVLKAIVLAIFPESSHTFFGGVTVLGDTLGIAIVAILMLIWLWFKKRDYPGMVILLVSVGFGNEINKWIKDSGWQRKTCNCRTCRELKLSEWPCDGGINLICCCILFINKPY